MRSYAGTSNVILSQQASRFWIPFDVKAFESEFSSFVSVERTAGRVSILLALTPIDYLEHYCRVNNRRFTLYKRVFDKHKDIEGELPIKVRTERWAVVLAVCSQAERCLPICVH
jgi:hypothetical protein